MKLFLNILLLFAVSFCFGQNIDDTTFIKIYSGEDYDYAEDLILTSDSHLLVVGSSSSFSENNSSILLVKMDLFGNVIWVNTYSGDGVAEGSAIIECEDGNYLMAGISDDNEHNDYDLIALKTDTAGNLIWTKRYGMNGWDVINDVVETDSGNYVFCGQSYYYNSPAGWLVRYNELTDNFDQSLLIEPDYETVFNALTKDTNNNIYVAGSSINPSLQKDRDVFLQKYTGSLDSIWSVYGGRALEEATGGVTIRKDGDVVLVGKSYNQYEEENDPAIFIVDSASGQLNFANYYSVTLIGMLNDVIATADSHKTAAIGTSYNSGTKYDALFVTSNEYGQFVNGTIRTSPEFDDESSKAIVRINNGYYLCGNSFGWSVNYSGFFLIKTDSIGELSSLSYENIDLDTSSTTTLPLSIEQHTTVVNDELSIHPNPLNREQALTVTPPAGEIVALVELYNLKGQLISQHSNQKTISFPEQTPTGIYIVKTTLSDGSIHRNKLVVR